LAWIVTLFGVLLVGWIVWWLCGAPANAYNQDDQAASMQASKDSVSLSMPARNPELVLGALRILMQGRERLPPPDGAVGGNPADESSVRRYSSEERAAAALQIEQDVERAERDFTAKLPDFLAGRGEHLLAEPEDLTLPASGSAANPTPPPPAPPLPPAPPPATDSNER
jgi:hypothetical protein